MQIIKCSRCGASWDMDYLRCNLVQETDLPRILQLVFRGRLLRGYREAFRRLGWEFGRTIYRIRKCPACPDESMSVLLHAISLQALDELLMQKKPTTCQSEKKGLLRYSRLPEDNLIV